MGTDRKVLYAISGTSLVTLLAVLAVSGSSGRILAAILLLPQAAAHAVFIKKRNILSINKRQVLLLMTVTGVLYLVLYYFTGLYFGFSKTGYKLNLHGTLNFLLPITGIILTSEIIRRVIRAQNSRLADVLSYLTCVGGEILIYSGISGVQIFNQFMDLVSLSLFPALVSNLLYHYLSKRYGAAPNMAYRLLTTLYAYSFPYRPAMPDSLFAFVNLIVPLLIYGFIDLLFEKKRRYALGKKSHIGAVLSVLAVAVMGAAVMLISNQFRFGALVIATESMTGALDKGDAAIFERYDDQRIQVGQVIVFENNDAMVVHRVIDIKYINGTMQYYTQGDANEEPDTGYATDNQVVGLVKLKVPYIGYPTLWLRSLFAHGT